MKKKGGVKPCVHVHKHLYTRGSWGHAPSENFSILDCLRLVLVHSQGLYIEAAISVGEGGQVSPPAPLNEPL